MSARRVHAVLAAGAQNPHLIERWRKDPKFLISQGIEPNSIDLLALWQFAGLTVKVRHNMIRQELPLTFRFMNAVGFEIEIFASYATFCASKGLRYATTPGGRVRALIAFLQQWLDFKITNHLLLWDLIRHEQALSLLRKSVIERTSVVNVDDPAPSRSALRGSSVPVICGDIILHEMRCDPRMIESTLFQKSLRLSQIPLGRHNYCYWRSRTANEVQILELDEFGYYALSFVDGVRSAAALSAKLGGSRRPTRGFLRLLSQLAGVGVLEF